MAKEAHASLKFDRFGYGMAIIPATLFILLVTMIPKVASGNSLIASFSWVPSLNVGFSLLVDGLSLLFGLVITLIGTLVVLYAGAYLVGSSQLKRL